MYLLNIDPTGRVLGGGWTAPEVVPYPLPDNVLAIEQLPPGGITDYRWDGKELIYDPAEQPEPEPEPRPDGIIDEMAAAYTRGVQEA